MSETKLKVGDKIWYVMNKAYCFKRKPELIASTVSKVGKTHFKISDLPKYRFLLCTMADEHPSIYKAYLNESDYYNEVEADAIYKKIEEVFSSRSNGLFTLDQLKQVEEILGIVDL